MSILTIIIFILIFIVLISFILGLLSIHPRKHLSTITPKDFKLEYEEVWLETEDKIKLNAWLIANKKSKEVIIACHGYPFDKGHIFKMVKFLAKSYNLFLFDFRGLGKSKGAYTTAGYLEVKDFNASVNYMLSKGFKKIGAIGFSAGASTILNTKNTDIRAIVADSPFLKLEEIIEHQYKVFGILKMAFVATTYVLGRIVGIDILKVSPIDAIKSYKIPILLIHGKKDSKTPYEDSIKLHKANKNSELWLVEDAEHISAHFVKTAEYEKKVMSFFNKAVK